MSGFTESGFERKLAELNSSQQSIQGLSAWAIHHRKHYQTIVKVWYKEFLRAQEHRKLTFIYLANDVVQNGRKKGTEFIKAFAPIFKKAFEYMAKIPGEKVKKSVLRILAIWNERGIYEAKLIDDFQKSYLKAWNDLNGGDDEEYDPATADFDLDFDSLKGQVTTPPHGSSSEKASKESKPTDKDRKTDSRKDPSKEVDASKTETKDSHSKHKSSSSKSGPQSQSQSSSSTRKHESSGNNSAPIDRKKRKRSRHDDIETLLRKRSLEATNIVNEWEVDGVGQLEVKLSPSASTEPPTEDELIKIVKDLEKMPSTDGVTRGKIAGLAPELSETDRVDELCTDSDITRAFQAKFRPALELLYDYNDRLDKELEERKKASMKLQDFLYMQKDLLTQAEQRLEEHQSHVKVLTKKLEELKSHVLSMPDLSKLPSVTDGLAPLPSAGDLFNILDQE